MTTHYSYDEVPYPDLCYLQTHPDRLAVLGKLLGMTPAPIESCRVLEIGCAGGGNLLPMAFGLPGSTFVGIDLSNVQIERAQAVASELGLSNITFQQIDMMDMNPNFGQFDYIIAHGIYSWVPPQVQDKLLDICNHNLAPQGIAYISYNTYPGWHMLEIIRNMMLFRTRDISDPMEKSSAAREWVAFTADALTDSRDANYAGFLNNYLSNRPTQTAAFDHAALLHDEMEEFNAPVYFYQFAERAEEHGLQYLVEADFPTVMPNDLQPEVIDHLQQTARTTIEMEQYLDFLRNRGFRRTLLCHAEVSVNRRLVTTPIRDFYVTSSAHIVAFAPGKAVPGVERFSGEDGAVFATDHPVTKAAFAYLAEISPRAARFDSLLIEACRRVGITQPTDQDALALAANLLRAFSYSLELIEFHVFTPPIVTEISEYPVASVLARFQASNGKSVTSLWHRRAEVEGLSRIVLLNLDGQNNHAALLDFLIKLAQEGKFGVRDGDQLVQNPEDVRRILTRELDDTLRWLAHAGLLVG